MKSALTFPRHIWHEIGRVIEREVEETETFLFAIWLFTVPCHAMPSDLFVVALSDRDILGLVSLTSIRTAVPSETHALCTVKSNMAAILRADSMTEWWKSLVVFSVILKSLLIPA